MLSSLTHWLPSGHARAEHPRLRLFIASEAALVVCIGLLVLVGWSFNLEFCKRFSPQFVTMKANTAVSFLLMAVVLFLSPSAAARSHRRTRIFCWVLLALVSLIAVLTLSEYAFGWNFGLDELLFVDYEHHGTTVPPGRYSVLTGVDFLLLAAAFLLMDSQIMVSLAFIVIAFLVSLLGAIGYIYGWNSIFGPSSPVALALHTTVGFGLLSTGAMACHQDRGLTKLLVDGPSARSNRWLFLGAFSLPMCLGQVILIGYRTHRLGGEVGFALFTVLVTLSFIALFWATANARHQAEEASRMSEQQFQTLANAIPHLAWMADGTGHLFWYNRRWFDYTGTTWEEMEGWGWQKVHDPAILPDVLAQWQRAIATGNMFEMTFPLRSASGEFRTFLTRGEPLRDPSNRVVRWFGTNTDITDQKETEAELRRINAEMEEFAYAASHDLQEPLRMVKIYTQSLVRTIDQRNETIELCAGFIEQGVSRMQVLIRDLLAYSRVTHAEEAPSGVADLSLAMSEALFLLRDRLDESGAALTVQDLPSVRGDTAQMASVFQNLISNSLKYRRAEVPPAIHVAAQRSGDAWMISVQDNGIGFESQHADRIFGLFKRLHRDQYPGTGIGLAICKRIVERSGGRIWAEGKVGTGATFHFLLPSIRSDEAD